MIEKTIAEIAMTGKTITATAIIGEKITVTAMIGRTAFGSDLRNGVVSVMDLYGAGKTPLSISGSIFSVIRDSDLAAATTATGSVTDTPELIADSPMTTDIALAVATKKSIWIQVSFENGPLINRRAFLFRFLVIDRCFISLLIASATPICESQSASKERLQKWF